MKEKEKAFSGHTQEAFSALRDARGVGVAGVGVAFRAWLGVGLVVVVAMSLTLFTEHNFNRNLTRRRNSTRREYAISQRRAVPARSVLLLVIQRFIRFHLGVGVPVASPAKRHNDSANDHDE